MGLIPKPIYHDWGQPSRMTDWFGELQAEEAARSRLRKFYDDLRWSTLRKLDFLRSLPEEFSFAWQRSRRGYSVKDTWSFDFHMAKVIVGGVTDLRDRELGHPGELTLEEWKTIQTEIIDGFQVYIDENENYIHERSVQDELKVDRAWDLFHYWFQALWD